ncbi:MULTISPECIES: RNA polymerase factor sigma-54 [Sphingobium]|uniref:RNA polymerase factor sigma-54 n=1 Tax=Sphingobium TaxID=165695 RepID=UPI0015ECA504|nr:MULTISPECIES: RNA polymerase factor sigma-54 [Sphingobium]MCW2363025.1 RNA polymerase sigma-54 factor [Sphingobium sp. B10D3B]MCW2400295.1 RNA polymerase sigma-54 factor [Sphingobium sp. B10D7B]MCW2407273.1 RNA polymerase sigma-54 factor [Sphingobium xanthum]
MAMAPRLDLRQSQSLVMTPQLQQAIKLLALSNLELEAFIGGELERNPLLEAGTDIALPAREQAELPDGVEPQSGPDAPADVLIGKGSGEADGPLDVDHGAETFIDDGPSDRALPGGADPGRSSADFGADGPDFDSFAAPEQGLYEHLMHQAGAALSGRALMIAEHLIGQIDDAGYLEADLLETAYRLGVPLAEVEAVLAVIQGFDPAGIAARSLSECIALQAKEADRYDPAMATLIANLDILAKGQIAHLRRICGVDEEDMADMIRELRGYDPKPGLRYANDRPSAVVPDVLIAPAGNGWSVEINGATLPRILVNRRYHHQLASGARDKTSKAWVSDCLASANWLIKALDQRQRTILRVTEEILRRQEGFFRHGVAHLRPLTLRVVAEAVGLHESTISRVTSNKYLSCPRGTFELKFFFTSAIAAADGGEAASAEAVKSHIRQLIADEPPNAILSDDSLVDLLRERGFDIARRTVAKYREAIGLGSSVQRRRQKALGGR